MVIMSLACSCSKDTISSADRDGSYYGTWNWLRSFGGFAGGEIAPESVGYSVVVVLSSDGTYEYFENGALKYKTRFTIRKEGHGNCQDSVDVIVYDPPAPYHWNQTISLVNVDTLVLADQCMDCYVHIYVRGIGR
jgi:hypothetical protein